MKIVSLLFTIVAIITVIFSFNNSTTSQNDLSNFYDDKNYKEGEIIVMFKSNINVNSFVNNYVNLDLKVKEVLVKDMNIYLFEYDITKSAPVDALLSVIRSNDVAIAQFNHYVQERNSVLPNDTRFNEQWDKHNTGQTGGTPDADIDAPEAWDIATGNLTVFGDTIVVAIVDGGQQIDHQDLNTWRNWAEIPANNIDDDNNGYVDDVNGWNAISNNGTIPSNQHGTHCAGIAGARGNNAQGIAGVNWNVKTMPIVGSSGTEAVVVRAYGYALKQRKIYNQTNGSQGAFVVSTNSSFGVDNGQPANYPLWCAFYDSLGSAGILSAGAGPNNNVNIDIVGDIPTACPSNFMIAVTNTTNTDAKNSGAGYGPINMDLGAPGTSILSTVPGNSYGLLTGTSMATPQVAGAIGLIHSGASSLFIQLVRNDPDSAALLFKQYILSSVDTIPALTGITVSNGRLNINKMLQKVRVTNVPVLNPFQLRTPNAGTTISTLPFGTTQYTFTWDTSATGATYRFVFGNPTTTPRKISLATGLNSLTLSSGQLDNILAGLGLNQGDSLVGQWDVWTYRLLPVNDSLKSSNGPRSLTLRRGVPALTAFNLVSPPSGTTITTSVFNTSNININWSRSGQGVTYKWKFGSPTLSNIRLSRLSNNSGFDTVHTIANNALDGLLQGLGLNPGDSLVGQYAVWAYNATDSVKSTQTYALTLKRQARGDVIVVYDSTVTLCRTSRDSIVNNLSNMSATFDLYNRRGNTTGTASISFRGYRKVIILGEGTSVMSNILKDSLKSYLAAGTPTVKSKLIIMAEDVGYHLDRTASAFYDSAFARSTLGFAFIADRIGTGIHGLVGVTTNPNAADSCAGPFPELLRRSPSLPQSQLHNLYRYRLFPDSMNSVGRISPTFNVAIMGVDVESLRRAIDSPPGSPVFRFLKGSMDYVDGLLTGVDPTSTSMIPTEYSLSQNYPNPFNPTTKITFSLPKQEKVTLRIYDVLGKEVMTLVNEDKPAGVYNIEFNATNFASGAYFYRIEAGDFRDIKRMILIK